MVVCFLLFEWWWRLRPEEMTAHLEVKQIKLEELSNPTDV
jgi:hypothetical protein